MSFEHLPQELIVEQLRHLSIDGILNACPTNHQFSQVCQGNVLWQTLLQRDFPEAMFSPRDLYLSKIIGLRSRINYLLERAGLHRGYLNDAIFQMVQTREADFFEDIRGDGLVAWLDYPVAGTPEEIYHTFYNLGIHHVESGRLNEATGGLRGYPPGVYPLTLELIRENSLNPNDPVDQGIMYPE